MKKLNILFLFTFFIFLSACNALNFDDFGKLDTELKKYNIDNENDLERILEDVRSNIRIILDSGIFSINRVLLYNVHNVVIEGSENGNTQLVTNFEIKNSENIGLRNLEIVYRGASLHKYIFRVKNTTNFLMENVIIKKARTNAIEIIESKMQLNKCAVESNESSGILIMRGSDVYINKTEVYNNKNYGIAVVNSVLKIENTKVYNNKKSNIAFERGSKGIIKNLIIQNSITESGIRVRKSHVNVFDTQLIYNKLDGITHLDKGKSLIDNCYISFNENSGISTNNSVLQIENSLFERNSLFGGHFMKSRVILRNSKIIDTVEGCGVYSEDTLLNLVGSILHHNKKSGIIYINSRGTILSTLSSDSVSESGLFSDNSIIDINLSNFKYNKKDGIKFVNNTVGNIKNTKITLNFSDGLDISSSKVKVIKCTLSENMNYGLKADKSVITLKETSIKDNGKGSILENESNINKN